MDGLIEKFDVTDAVNQLLASKAFNQSTLAEALNITQGRISQMSNGNDAYARYETRYKLNTLCVENGIVTSPAVPRV